ncbi:ester cyclase [Geodermatophilus sp. URMC 62]|uniref:ester cyclase n=1 Tax=Geodermatophilus sp. URMC 62 TaxID=3423414 RepID=UPI00406D0668
MAVAVGVEDNKRLVARAVTEVINRGNLAAVEELYAPDIAAAAREWVAPFRTAFPDVRMETVALVGEGDTVVGHFRCSGTHTGRWMGRRGTGRAFRDVREVYWFTVRGGRIVDWWGLEDNDDRRRQLRAGGTPA